MKRDNYPVKLSLDVWWSCQFNGQRFQQKPLWEYMTIDEWVDDMERLPWE